MEDSLDRYLETCLKAARAGGAVLLDWAGRFAAREKGPADLVTEADLASQEAVRGILLGAFSDHGFLGEENGASTVGKDGYRWMRAPRHGPTTYVPALW